MKKFMNAVALVLVMALALSFASCSTYGKVKKAFEKAGYEEVENKDYSEKYAEQAEEQDITVFIHVLRKQTGTVLGVAAYDYCTVIEFKSSKDMDEYISESETLKGVIKDAQKSDYVNGTCILVPLCSNDVLEVFKNA